MRKNSVIKLYDFELSGNCYKIRLLLSLLGIEFQSVPVDLLAGEHKQAAFLALNPKGEVPVLQDDELRLFDSQAMLVYLASRYAGPQWYPDDPAARGRIQQWLSTAANEVAHGPAAARVSRLFDRPIDYPAAVALAQGLLAIVEQRLTERDWLETDQMTIADVAMFPYLALSHQGGIELEPYPAVREWIARIKALPGFVGMPAI